jgi:hypothetical protein
MMNRVLTVLPYIFATGQITANTLVNSYVDKCTPVAPKIVFKSENVALSLNGRILSGELR